MLALYFALGFRCSYYFGSSNNSSSMYALCQLTNMATELWQSRKCALKQWRRLVLVYLDSFVLKICKFKTTLIQQSSFVRMWLFTISLLHAYSWKNSWFYNIIADVPWSCSHILTVGYCKYSAVADAGLFYNYNGSFSDTVFECWLSSSSPSNSVSWTRSNICLKTHILLCFHRTGPDKWKCRFCQCKNI